MLNMQVMVKLDEKSNESKVPTKYNVLAVEPIGLRGAQEELGAVLHCSSIQVSNKSHQGLLLLRGSLCILQIQRYHVKSIAQ